VVFLKKKKLAYYRGTPLSASISVIDYVSLYHSIYRNTAIFYIYLQ
jgi:hypothetical protein